MIGFAGSRKFPEVEGRALTRALLAQFPAQVLVTGLCAEGADAWCLEEGIGLRIVRNEDGTLWIGPDPARAYGVDADDKLPDPVWYRSTQRVRIGQSTPCYTAEFRGFPYYRHLGKQGGFARNVDMARQARDATWLLLWDSESRGTRQMLDCLIETRAHVEVYTPACPVTPELRVVGLQKGEEPAFQVVYHGPRESARVVSVLDRTDLDLYARPWAATFSDLQKQGYRVTVPPAPWTRP